MKIVCLIPARGGSRGIPKKNIRKLGSKPLIAHTIESCKKSGIFNRIIVSTDDKEIARIANTFGAEIPFMRPKKLAGAKSPMDDVVMHLILELKKNQYEFDILVLRDCTVPFIQIKDIKKSINILKKNKSDLVCGVYRQHLNPYFNMVEIDKYGNLRLSKKISKKIKTRQEAPIVYQLNGLLTINVKSFLKYGKIYMPKCLPCEIPPETGIMIDTELEFQIANCIAKKQIKIN